MEAAREAADEIGMAVIATTFTLIAVFLPTAFMPGVPGKFFVQFRLDGSHRGLLLAGRGPPAHAHDGGLHPEEAAEKPNTAEPFWMPGYLQVWLAGA